MDQRRLSAPGQGYELLHDRRFAFAGDAFFAAGELAFPDLNRTALPPVSPLVLAT
jgi:hypothetical protein